MKTACCLLIGWMLSLAAWAQAPANSLKERAALREQFLDWQHLELAYHRYWAKDSCAMAWFHEHGYDSEEEDVAIGFPEIGSCRFYYADLNQDGKLDQLVTFNPVQCDGGNGLMWTQVAVLSLSHSELGYTTGSEEDGLFVHLKMETPGFYWFTGMGANRLEAIYYVFGEEDNPCCPGIQTPVVFAYDTGEIIERGPNRTQEPESHEPHE